MVSRWWEKLPTKFTNVTLGEYVIMPNHFHGIIHITKPNPINTTVGAPPTVGATQRGRPSSSQPETTTDVGNNFQTSSNANGGQPHGAAPTGNETSTGNPTGNETPTRNSTQNEIPTGNSAQSENPTVTDNVTLGEIIGWFKTMTTNEYIRGVKQLSWQPFNKHFWQRNYFERIVRDDKSLNAITHYIFNNPKHWGSDSENTFR